MSSIKAKVAPFVRSAIKAGAETADRFVRPPAGVTILIYHRVGAGNGGQMDLAADEFDRQLGWLSATQRIISLDDALTELAGSEPVEPGVVLTFDDGTTDWVDNVLPALERHRVPATFYVATQFVDEQLPFPGDGDPITWAGLKEMSTSDLVTLGAHTHSHALLDRLPDEQVADELDRSNGLLRDKVGIEPAHFAYPKALPGSPEADRAVRERYRSAVIALTRPNLAGGDPFLLTRAPIQPSDGDRWFRRKAEGGMAGEDSIRQAMNLVRYRGAVK